MNIIVDVIPHEDQRYDTVGDWQFKNGDLRVRVSKCEEKSEVLIAIHEIIEAILCKYRGITEEQVDQWDMSHSDSDDPGSLPNCPYNREHFIAENVEAVIAARIGVIWKDHEKVINSL